jgi:penicillin V acylase-like amidase (Ntn superfamily)
MRSKLFCALGVSSLVSLIVALDGAAACTRVLWNDNKLAVIAGRTMDWPSTTDPILTVLPRGMKRDGGAVGGVVAVKENPLRWTSRYGSLITSVYGVGTADGLNEKGLTAHMLYLKPADYGVRDVTKPGLQAGLWAQYALDNAATVSEALALLENVQIILVEAHGSKATVHLALEDVDGDSAIIEYVKGKPLIHHGRDYKVMTNDPPYDQQLELMKKWDFTGATREMALPGNVSPTDRFVRATYFSRTLPEPKTQRAAVAGMFSVMRNVSVPFGAPYTATSGYATEYRTVTDVTNKRYFFELTTSPNVVWVDLMKFNLNPSAPVKALNPDSIELSGDVTRKFTRAKAPF